jgi:hypothetical protein
MSSPVRARKLANAGLGRRNLNDGLDNQGSSRCDCAWPMGERRHLAVSVSANDGRRPNGPDTHPKQCFTHRTRCFELGAIWHATAGAGAFNGIVRLLMLTGQRREEVAGMTSAELSGDFSTWTVPASRAKNGTTHIVPLSAPAQDLLRNVPRFGELAFPGLRGPFNGWSKAKAALDAKSGVTNWRLHDLRRTAATGLQRLGVRLEVTEQVLNHVSGSRADIVGVYQRHDFASEKRAALEAWGEHVLAVVEGRTAMGNVVTLRESA